ncbi:hypothetical protein HGRIS_014704 [Hohenbuehelia grisea]|uniref:Transport protein USO1 n=1 Tax=Hohenbuehelia grisea TaxID=104357 RepID=A0ABR3IQG7_9AGAR
MARRQLSLSVQQPMPYDRLQGGPLFSPALATPMQPGFHPQYMNNPLQTPMQLFFNNQPPPAPGRPTHRAAQGSIAQLAAAGIHPPSGFPITPLGGHFPRHSMAMGQPPIFPGGPPPQPFQGKHRKQLSVGGPPKAVLGGPGRKHSPLPVPVTNAAAAAAVTSGPKQRKVVVNLPKESVLEENGTVTRREPWPRTPLPPTADPEPQGPLEVETSSAQLFPPDYWRTELPDVIDVFLPGRAAWDAIWQKTIEDKLERLGVEPASGSNVPHIFAPHARAASISSPADPALLMFKLNKLQQAQTSGTNSLSTSPQPQIGLSPSPHQAAPRFISNHHGYSLSLAQPLTLSIPTEQQQWPHNSSVVASNPFGPNAILGGDMPAPSLSPGLPPARSPGGYAGIAAPQGRVPVTVASLAPPPLSAVRPPSRPDFTRGFGLDIPEEEEPEEEGAEGKDLDGTRSPLQGDAMTPEDTSFVTNDSELSGDQLTAGDSDAEGDFLVSDGLRSNGASTVAQSCLHSRHVSRLSGALTLASVGGVAEDDDFDRSNESGEMEGDHVVALEEVDEWTGSEDLYLEQEHETSDDESLDEYSNPSDEERARRDRLERRLRKRTQRDLETPRRLPEFPRPPENTVAIPLRRGQHPDDHDIISNPSEEEHIRETASAPLEYLSVAPEYHHPAYTSDSRSSRPLPGLPHSRSTSITHLSHHDPAQAHSRATSDQAAQPGYHNQHSSLGSRSNSLNPFAKPFVFGAPKTSGSWASQSVASPPPMPIPVPTGHVRLSSFGKPLNAAAQEFTPGGFAFDFRPPPGVPQMVFPDPEPQTHPELSAQIAAQGREKRQRRESLDSPIEEGDSMSSFKFPRSAAPQDNDIQRSSTPKNEQPHQARGNSLLNPAAQPFRLSSMYAGAAPAEPEDALHDDSTARADSGPVDEEEVSMPPSVSKPKRAPIPLDFKHSNTTVPAGLFKALVNQGEERTRRSVRSRLGSREVLDTSRRASLESIDVPTISRKMSRSLLNGDATKENYPPADRRADADLYGPPTSSNIPNSRHRHSPLHSAGESMLSGVSVSQTGRIDLQHLEQRLENVLEDRFDAFSRDIQDMLGAAHTNGHAVKVDASTEEKVDEVISLFRAQLKESTLRSLENSRVDARGDVDIDFLQEFIQQSQAKLFTSLKRELEGLNLQLRGSADQASSLAPQDYVTGSEVKQMMENFSSLTVGAVVEAIQEQSVRLETVERGTPARDRDILVEQLVNALMPLVNTVRAERVDYDHLTEQLAQAVKPHISQLIDLTSDKRETAGLIMERLVPLLPSNASLDTDSITLQLVTEIRRAIAPIDAFEIKEQVADLVVERLDARLAVRDKGFSAETLSSKVTESVSQILDPLQDTLSILARVEEGQKVVNAEQAGLSAASNAVLAQLDLLSTQLSSAVDEIKVDDSSKAPPVIDTTIFNDTTALMKSSLDALVDGQGNLYHSTSEILSKQQEVMDHLSAISKSINESSSILQASMLDAKSASADSREIDELRKTNSDLQVQLAKARGSHGQVRVEKDLIGEKLLEVESDRDSLRSRLKEAQDAIAHKATEAISFESRNKELEVALAQALARLQASDVASQAYQGQIVQLEKANRELASEKQNLKSKVDSLEIQSAFANRDKDAAVQALSALQKQHDLLSSQQEHWDTLQSATTQIATLTALMDKAGNEELAELKRTRDRSRVLEGENTALQKRLKDQEAKATNSDKAAAQIKQSLAQTQQRSLEWEKRAKEYEGQLELTKTKLDQAEQTHAQLDADYTLAKMQLEERDADDRLVKDRENKLNDHNAHLEAKVLKLEAELEVARTRSQPTVAGLRKMANTLHAPPRPDSRTSTAYGDVSRSVTPNPRIASYTTTTSVRSDTPEDQDEKGVQDSMHAPPSNYQPAQFYMPPGYPPAYHAPVPSRYPMQHRAPKGRPVPTYPPRNIPSPTPSTVSQAPTLGADGWYE